MGRIRNILNCNSVNGLLLIHHPKRIKHQFACGLCYFMVIILFFQELSYTRKLALGFAILAILHEFEEKRIPGGFFELMAKNLACLLKARMWILQVSLLYVTGLSLPYCRMYSTASQYSWLCQSHWAFLKHLSTLRESGFIVWKSPTPPAL